MSKKRKKLKKVVDFTDYFWYITYALQKSGAEMIFEN